MDGKTCYLRCATIDKDDAAFVRLRFTDVGVPNWEELLQSKSRKRLRNLNKALDQKSADVDQGRAALSEILKDYLAGMALEQTIRKIHAEVTQLQASDVALRRDIIEGVRELERVEEELQAISGKQSMKRKRKSNE